MGDHINAVFFYKKMYGCFARQPKKEDIILNEVTILPSGPYPKQNCNVYCTCGFTLKTCFLFAVPCCLYTVCVVHVKGVLMVKVLNLFIYINYFDLILVPLKRSSNHKSREEFIVKS